MNTSRWPDSWPWVALEVATKWYGWLPRFNHTPARYHRAHSRIAAALAQDGTRMSRPSSAITWGPARLGVVWP